MAALAGFAQEAGPDTDDYRSLWKRGEYRRALEALDAQMEPRLPHVPSFWLRNRAELRFRVGDVDGAIEDFKTLDDRAPDAATALRLAELYRYRGRRDDFEQALTDAHRRIETALGSYITEDTLLTAGRIAELLGEDPKRILSTIYEVLMTRATDFAPGFVAAGRLALEKGSYALAEGYYTKALEADPENEDALAGLAACYWKSRDERLEEVLARIDALNPHLPDGVAVRVEMLLDAGEAEEALEKIEPVLAVNPNQLRFRALKAAALFLQDDIRGMESVQRDTLNFNPYCSEVYRVPGEVASRHYRFAEAEALQRKALEADPEDSAARAELAINLLRLGRDAEGRTELETAFAADPYSVRVFNTLKVLDTLAEFETVSRGPFEVQLPKDEAPVLAPSALKLLEEAYALLQSKYDVAVETPVRVQMFDNHDDFMVRSLGLPGNAGHLGICFGRLITMDSPSARPKGSTDWQAVLWHEFAHVITLQKTKNRMPRWLSEGISVHEETLRHPGWGMRLEPSYGEILGEGDLPGVTDLELFFTQPKTPAHLMLGYFLAGEFVTNYVRLYGDTALVDALDRIGRKEEALDALAAGAGVSMETLNETFRAHLRRRLEVLENLPAFAQAMQRGHEALAAESWEAAEGAFQEAHRLYPEFSPEGGPLAGLEKVYEATGQTEKEMSVLRARLALDTAALPVWQRLARLHKEAGNWEGVVEAAAGSAAVDPFDVEMTRLLYEAQRARGAREEALEAAERLRTLDAPRAAEYELARVELLMGLERWDEARRQAVLLLEARPHYWEAQELLLALAERETP